jgi:hypothetical protein
MKHRASVGWLELSSDPTHRSRHYDSTAQHPKANQQYIHEHTLSVCFISVTESFITDDEVLLDCKLHDRPALADVQPSNRLIVMTPIARTQGYSGLLRKIRDLNV